MNPGRELDLLVGEKIFGAPSYALPSDKPVTATQLIARESAIIMMPDFSTDIAAAWQVVEKIRNSRFSVRQNFSTELRSIVSEKLGSVYLIDHSEVLTRLDPRDICLAALKAFGAFKTNP